MEGRCGAPAHAGNDADELCKMARDHKSKARRKHAVDQLIYIVPYPVVGINHYPANVEYRVSSK
jgi:hypothetical protein